MLHKRKTRLFIVFLSPHYFEILRKEISKFFCTPEIFIITVKQRHSGERRNPDSATFSWIPDQVRNDVKIRAKALRLKGEGFRPGEWKNKKED